jgi:hypothetical protein
MDQIQTSQPVTTTEAASQPLPTTDQPKVETKTEPPKPIEKESSRFAALARKEKTLVKRQMEAKQAEEKIAQMYAEVQKWESAKKTAKTSPIEALKMLGISYEDVTNYMLNGEKPTPELEIKSELDNIKAEILAEKEERRRVIEEQKKEAEEEAQRAIEEFNEEIKTFLKDNSNVYELIALNEASDLVLQVIEQHFAETKKILSKQEAADMVEKYLEDQITKSAATNKMKAKLTPAQKEEEKKSESVPSKTLNNEYTSSSPNLYLSAKTENQRIQRALAALEGTKN